MLEIIIPLLTMLIGFLCGIMAEGVYKDDTRMDKLERRIKKLEGVKR